MSVVVCGICGSAHTLTMGLKLNIEILKVNSYKLNKENIRKYDRHIKLSMDIKQ